MNLRHIIFGTVWAVSIASGTACVAADGLPSGAAFLAGEPNKPLVVLLTTDAASSMDGTYTSIGGQLHQHGYSLAAVDVTCHGKDVRQGEQEGLGCWASRVQANQPDIFSGMIQQVSALISSIQEEGRSSGDVVAVGVSRGGYAALRLAIADPRVSTLVLMAPVTRVERLSEFTGVVVPPAYDISRNSKVLSTKRIFMQIGNSDDRVGTDDALALMRSIVTAGGGKPVDLTVIVTPNRGHGTERHSFAAQWVQERNEGAQKAP